AESVASLLKVFSGWISDRIGRRKGLTIAGYAGSALGKLLLALAAGWGMVLTARIVDRLGKGILTAPRDALIADSAHDKKRHGGSSSSSGSPSSSLSATRPTPSSCCGPRASASARRPSSSSTAPTT